MPRRPSRPVPTLEDTLGVGVPGKAVSRLDTELDRLKVRAQFFQDVAYGLLGRLERLHPKEKWLRQLLENPEWRDRLIRGYGIVTLFGGRIAAHAYLCGHLTLMETPRKNTPVCDAGMLLLHYDLAERTLRELKVALTGRWRNPHARVLSARQWAQDLLAALGAKPYTCTCQHQTALPPDFDEHVLRLRTERSLIEYVLAHHHGVPQRTLRKLLEEGSRTLRELRQRRSQPKSSPKVSAS